MSATGLAITTELQAGIGAFILDIGGVSGAVASFIVVTILAGALIAYLRRSRV